MNILSEEAVVKYIDWIEPKSKIDGELFCGKPLYWSSILQLDGVIVHNKRAMELIYNIKDLTNLKSVLFLERFKDVTSIILRRDVYCRIVPDFGYVNF